MDASGVVEQLRAMEDPAAVEGMKRFGIMGKEMLGVSMPDLRKLAKKVGRSHRLALELWAPESTMQGYSQPWSTSRSA